MLNETNQAQFDDLLGQLLHAIGTQWFFNLVYERDFYATTTQVAYTRLPSETIATADLTVTYWFGIPRSASPGPFTVDADVDALAVSPISGASARRKDFMLLAGMTGSAREHRVFEGFFATPAVSSMKLLRIAADQGIPIHRINSSNIAQILPLLSLASDDLADIQNGVAVGKEAIVSQSEVQIGNYRGVGLLILDPERGDGVYLISGGIAGGYAFELDEWRKDVYTKVWAGLRVRNLVLDIAKGMIGTLYGLGCKDRDVTGTPQVGRCAEEYGADSTRLDCSGFVESVYFWVGFQFFVGRNAQSQYDFVRSNFRTSGSVLFGDLVFFENTYDKNRNNIRSDDGVTHVGIVWKPEMWIAAEGDFVEAYCTAGYRAANPSAGCLLTGVWPGKYANFYSYGSVISER
jgi:cell wall-associated NlpC family hydrolase